MSSPDVDTIVIGLGISGLTVLTTLAKAGRSVLGLEAAARIGGRIKTVPFADGVVELGAEWIHGTVDSPLYDLAVANRIPLTPQDITFRAYRSNRAQADQALVNELIDHCLGLAEHPPEEPEPLGEFIVRECRAYIKKTHPQLLADEDFLNEFLHFMNLFVCNYEASDSWCDVTTSSQYTELQGHQHMSWHRHGYSTLFDIVLNKYNGGAGYPDARLLLSSPVSRVQVPRGGEHVRVTCSDGRVYTARSAVVTVSLGVLKENHKALFDPPLPPQKVAAIENISIGVMDKVILSFDHSWWPQDVTFFGFIWRGDDRRTVEDEDGWVTRIFGASCPRGASKALTLWTSGETGKLVETLPEDVVKRKLTELLRRFMGGDVTVPEPTGIIRSTWHSDPLTRGSYTFDNLQRPLHPHARRDLATPLCDDDGTPRVLFAGEATNEFHFSTVHGAIETGLREANRLLEVKSKI